jgi:hypothetical protein
VAFLLNTIVHNNPFSACFQKRTLFHSPLQILAEGEWNHCFYVVLKASTANCHQSALLLTRVKKDKNGDSCDIIREK